MMGNELYAEYADKLKKIIKANCNKNYEAACAGIAAYAQLSYNWNQFYTDEEIEDVICRLSDKLLADYSTSLQVNEKVVLFYDAFGFDTRGLAAIYAKALIDLDYKVIWVTTDQAKDNIPTIEKYLKQGTSQLVFINLNGSFLQQINQLNEQFQKYKPARAFFYTMPDDVSAEIVFYHYRNIVKRFLINLTDHAFWLGIHAFDYCIEFREYGAGISKTFRKIREEKIVLLPYYPVINKDISFQGFPFDTAGKKIVFSGGRLYKTIGGDNKFYKVVNKVLASNNNVIFLYAGSGDDSELKKLDGEFPGRVYHINERHDLFALMMHIDVYLNTYPMVGGLMMQYAALAGKPPVTLHDAGKEDDSGILINQKSSGIEFETVDEAVNEINHLLQDDSYRAKRAAEISKSVITPADFSEKLYAILQEKARNVCVDCPDTESFRKEYAKRFKSVTVEDSIAISRNKKLLPYFPLLFIHRTMRKVFH